MVSVEAGALAGSPTVLPATLTTNTSLTPWSKRTSTGTLASAHETTAANGVWELPTGRESGRWGLFSTYRALPFMRRSRAWAAATVLDGGSAAAEAQAQAATAAATHHEVLRLVVIGLLRF